MRRGRATWRAIDKAGDSQRASRNATLLGKRGSEFISRFTRSGQLGQVAEMLHPYFVQKPAIALSRSVK
jgi:hypothetical protein